MRTIQTIAAVMVVVTMQVTNTLVQNPVTAQLKAPRAEAAGTGTHVLTFNTKTIKPLGVVSTIASFDEAVVQPLKAKQAAQAIALAVKQAAYQAQLVRVKATPVIIGGDDAFAQLRFCEAGGDYAKNTGNGYFGAYQYNLGTWANYGGFARPDLAPPAMQDAKARETQSKRGWSPWPACSRKLGLM